MVLLRAEEEFHKYFSDILVMLSENLLRKNKVALLAATF